MTYKIGILVMSDKGSRGEREDRSGKQIQEMLGPEFSVDYYDMIPDEKQVIIDRLHQLCDEMALDLVLTSGGTGFSPRDVTPDACLEVIEKPVPGIPEAIRSYGMQKTPKAMLSRGVAGLRGKTLIINLPGSVKGVRESMEVILPILPHGIDTLRGDSSECGQD
ncbi:MAG: MogA/MoaB family molybdenum cofactor biosynthesis protein [Bacillota bacterium]|nr:MogA/MoaB family molybdenum cofactor biosynthesis protein [Bacillota bacterium]